MKNKLMIGDWMKHANGNYYQITRIDALSDGSIHYACGTPHLWEYNNKFEPIPLTEEILQKNFPDPSELVWFPLDTLPGYFNIYWEHPSFGDGEIRLNIQYVHELQHILKIVGLTKEIKL